MQVIPIETIRSSAYAAVRAGQGLDACPVPLTSAAALRWFEIYAHILSFIIEVENGGVEEVVFPEHAKHCAGAEQAYCGQCVYGLVQLDTANAMTPDFNGVICQDFDRADRFQAPSASGGEHG